MRVAIAQIAPVLLDRAATIERIVRAIHEACDQGANLVCFGETLLPAYPVWLCRTDGARFDDPEQKELHERYLDQAVTVERGHLAPICDALRERQAWGVLGVAERPDDRAGHTIYCSCVVIDAGGMVQSVHRKLMPTYEERLAWGAGDGAGLVAHDLGEFRLGALNCWENWMPLARAALHAQGVDLHVALWPGCERLTRDITRFIALESRSYVISASGLIRDEDIPAGLAMRNRISSAGEVLYDGGSCVAGPDGAWVVEPVVGEERVIVVDLYPASVLRERQNFDHSGHYARPDVLRLIVDRRRQGTVSFEDERLEDDRGAPP